MADAMEDDTLGLVETEIAKSGVGARDRRALFA